MLEKKVIIKNKLGLHARAAGKFVSIASRYSADIQIAYQSKMINGKSILAVMLLAAHQGTELTLIAEGEDAEDALESLAQLIDDKFGEEE